MKRPTPSSWQAIQMFGASKRSFGVELHPRMHGRLDKRNPFQGRFDGRYGGMPPNLQ